MFNHVVVQQVSCLCPKEEHNDLVCSLSDHGPDSIVTE